MSLKLRKNGQWVDIVSSSTSSTFIELTDTPTDYTGSSNKFLAVNSGGTAVEFVDAPSGGSSVDVKQYADDNQTEYGGINPISVESNAGISTIGIGTTSNAYGTRYVQSTEPTSSYDGDIWYDTSVGSSADVVTKIIAGNGISINPTSGTGEVTITSNSGNTITQSNLVNVTGASLVSEIELTGIPSNVKRITLFFYGLSLTSNNHILVQLGTSSQYFTTGYQSAAGAPTAYSNNNTNGFVLFTNRSDDISTGTLRISRVDTSLWIADGVLMEDDADQPFTTAGYLGGTGGATIDRLRLISAGDTGDFDNDATIRAFYEF